MKKVFVLCLFIVCIYIAMIIGNSCFLKNDLSTYEYYKATLIDNSHKNSYVKVEYPQLKGKNQCKTNAIIKMFAENFAKNIYGEDYNDLNLDISFEVTYNRNGLLSIVFKGLGNVKNMPYPNNLFRTINIDMGNSKIIHFDDVYSIENETISVISRAFHKQLIPERFGYTTNDQEYTKIKQSFTSVGGNVKQILSENSKFYFTDKYVCICLDTYHSLGDYFIIEVEYDELEAYKKYLKSRC